MDRRRQARAALHSTIPLGRSRRSGEREPAPSQRQRGSGDPRARRQDFSHPLGMLAASAKANLLSPESWKKSNHPVFFSLPSARANGTGHNSFFKSPDGA